MTARRARGAVAAVALCALLAGCGGSGAAKTAAPKLVTPSTPAPVASASAPFTERAGAICAAANHQIAALPASYATPVGSTGPALQAAAYARIGVTELAQLKALPAPAAKAQEWQRFLTAIQTANNAEGAIVAMMKGQYSPAPGQQVGIRDPAGVARGLGITACAESAVPSGG